MVNSMAMQEEIKVIVKHSSVYGLGIILQRIPPFILLPLYLNYLTPSDFGRKEIISLVVDFLGIVISMGIANAMTRFYYEYDRKIHQNEVVSTIIISFGIFSGLLLVAVSTQSENIAGVLIDSPSDKSLIIMALASLWFNTLYHMGLTYIRIKEKSGIYITFTVSKLCLQLGLNVLFIAHFGWGLYGIFISTLISSSMYFVILVIPLMLNIGFRFSANKLKEILKF